VRDDPALADEAEFRAVLAGDVAAVGEIGLERVALALAGLFQGLDPGSFTREVRTFFRSGTHPTLRRPLSAVRYAPMLELLDALRELGFSIGVVTGGGTEFVRAISQELYGVPPERVVGTMIAYELGQDAAGNSAGDTELLQWAAAADGPHLSLLLDHDDPDREFAYASEAQTLAATEPITATARRLGWTTISMREDWASVFVEDRLGETGVGPSLTRNG
jgi:hypothetical protein